MSYCCVFETEEEAIQNIGSNGCSNCEEYTYQDGLATCRKMLNKFENFDVKGQMQNENRIR